MGVGNIKTYSHIMRESMEPNVEKFFDEIKSLSGEIGTRHDEVLKIQEHIEALQYQVEKLTDEGQVKVDALSAWVVKEVHKIISNNDIKQFPPNTRRMCCEVVNRLLKNLVDITKDPDSRKLVLDMMNKINDHSTWGKFKQLFGQI